MIYTLVLLLFGAIPLLALWLLARQWIGRYAGAMLWLALMIVFVGASWEAIAIDRVWFFALGTVIGIRLLNIPLEEWAYYILDALLAATLSIVLMKVFASHRVHENVRS
jgi:lycopene cyclase domain-containing protein